MRIAGQSIGADEAHRDAVGLARDVERDLLAVKPHRAAALALHQAAGQLAGNLPLAFAQHMIDRGRDGGESSRDLAFRRARGKSLWKFLGDETGRTVSLTPARLMNQGG